MKVACPVGDVRDIVANAILPTSTLTKRRGQLRSRKYQQIIASCTGTRSQVTDYTSYN